MTVDQITGVIRAILAALSGFVLAKGWFSADIWNYIVSSILAIIPVIWTIIANRPAAIAATAQSLNGVTVTTSAQAAPSVQLAVANQRVLTP